MSVTATLVAEEDGSAQRAGVSVDFFCYATKWLGKKYPRRAVEVEATNRLLKALHEAEQAYSELPLLEKKKGK